jgi:hypothetical protein
MLLAAKEARLHRIARKAGLAIRKSRSRTLEVPGYGGYMIVDPFNNTVVAGAYPHGYSLTLEEIAEELGTEA